LTVTLWLKTTKTFNVPQATSRSECQGKSKVAKEAKTDVEETVVQRILDLEPRVFFLPTVRYILKLPFDVAEQRSEY
jgi:hypothetical protein